jgi:hypothetical protein
MIKLSSPNQTFVAAVVFMVVTVVGFVLTSGEYLFLKLDAHPVLGILAIGGELMVVWLVAGYRWRMVQALAWLFPIILLCATAFNLVEDKIGWDLQQQASNSLFSLASTSNSKNTVYVYLHEHHPGWTLVTTRDTLAQTPLTEAALLGVGRLDAVEYQTDDALPDAGALDTLLRDAQPGQIAIDDQVIVIASGDASQSGAQRLVLLPFQDQFVLVPYAMLSSGSSQS